MYHIAKLFTVDKQKDAIKVIVISDWIDQSTKTCFYPPKNGEAAAKLQYKAGKKWIKYQFAILGSFSK